MILKRIFPFLIIITINIAFLTSNACNQQNEISQDNTIKKYYDNGLMYYEYAVGLRGERPTTRSNCINSSIKNFQELLFLKMKGKLKRI